ncbi:MAG: flagellar hook-basal body complex protein FliE [Proteobacteria bacterium]|nr:flagellar hook-basal body complex protein FliE [Pseudomonadota bacterium]
MVTAVSGVSISPAPALVAKPAEAAPVEHNGFAEMLQRFSNTLQAGESAAISGIKGEVPMQQVVEKVLEAERTLTTAVSIRDKIVSAYLEMTRMQI